jgi:predicted enzyme related to lactoylglutathione lyase
MAPFLLGFSRFARSFDSLTQTLMKLKELAFTVYAVKDTKRASDFYRNTFGLRETANWEDKWIEFDVGPGTLAITDSFPQLTPGAKGAMVALEVDDFAACVEELKSKGVKLAMEPFDTPVCCGATVLDLDGNEVMIHQRKKA